MQNFGQRRRGDFLPAQERVLIVDDDPMVRCVLALTIKREGYQLVGEASSGEEALKLIGICKPSLMLLDLDMPQLEGFSVLQLLQRRSAKLPVLIMSMLDPAVYATRCMRLGACGFLSKGEGAALLPGAIQQVQRGVRVFPQPVSSVGMPWADLSNRELVTLRCLARGGHLLHIAEALSVARCIAIYLIKNLQAKLGLSTVELAEFGRRMKLG